MENTLTFNFILWSLFSLSRSFQYPITDFSRYLFQNIFMFNFILWSLGYFPFCPCFQYPSTDFYYFIFLDLYLLFFQTKETITRNYNCLHLHHYLSKIWDSWTILLCPFLYFHWKVIIHPEFNIVRLLKLLSYIRTEPEMLPKLQS